MATSIPQLQDQIRNKERELESVGNKLSGAGIGAALTNNPLIGAAAGAYLGREKNKKEQLEREIADLKRQIEDTERHISELKEKQSQLRNNYETDKVRHEADMRQKWNELERQKQNAPDAAAQQRYSDQISALRHDADAHQQQLSREVEAEIDSIQDEINRLTL